MASSVQAVIPGIENISFMKHGKFVKVQYQLGDIHPSRVDEQIFVKGARWAHPSEEDFKARIKKFYSSNDVPKEWALELQKKILEKYSFTNISSAYDDVLKDVIC